MATIGVFRVTFEDGIARYQARQDAEHQGPAPSGGQQFFLRGHGAAYHLHVREQLG